MLHISNGFSLPLSLSLSLFSLTSIKSHWRTPIPSFDSEQELHQATPTTMRVDEKDTCQKNNDVPLE